MNNNPYYVQRNSVPMPYYYNNQPIPESIDPNDERFGFLGPFLLGGITGGLVAPLFYNSGQRPYNNNTYYYPPYQYYNQYYY
jgi:hypothetical protein